jgi:RNA polymerase sigma-70 factor (ECF subfamily)
MSTDDDQALVELAKANPDRFAGLYDRYVDRVYAYVSRRIPDRAATEDITSEVFEKALAKLDQFEWRGTPFIAWLYRIAANAIADRWRKEGGRLTETLSDVPDAGELDDIERRVMLFQLVDRLPNAQQQVIRMRFTEERSIRDIAAALGRSEGAIKQLQLRALEQLRKEMGRHD